MEDSMGKLLYFQTMNWVKGNKANPGNTSGGQSDTFKAFCIGDKIELFSNFVSIKPCLETSQHQIHIKG